MFALILFWLLFGIAFLQAKQRQFLTAKLYQDWFVDGLGFCVQGGAIPLLQILLGLHIYQWLWPQAKGCLELAVWGGFIISFVGLDYLYYWNHRLLHQQLLFPIHALHHTVTQMDMLGTSRNTLWASLFLPYIWINSLMLYLLDDPRSYAFGFFLTCFLDLWRHSSLNLPQKSMIYKLLDSWLILPKDHAYHHSQNLPANFGANLKIWDRLHGTYSKRDLELQSNDDVLGMPMNMSLTHKLLWPFSSC